MLGTRGLWSDGWKVVAERGPQIGKGQFENDTWQLFHTDEDRSEAHDVAAEHPDLVKKLVDLWFVEAGKYDVLPLDDRSLAELIAVQPEAVIPPGGVWKYYPGTLEVPEFSAANTRGRSYKILAEVEIDDGEGPQALVRLQLHRHPAGAAARLGPRDRGGPARARGRVREGEPRASPAPAGASARSR